MKLVDGDTKETVLTAQQVKDEIRAYCALKGTERLTVPMCKHYAKYHDFPQAVYKSLHLEKIEIKVDGKLVSKYWRRK